MKKPTCCPKMDALGESLHRDGNGEWVLDGGCGGCYVLQDIRYCPFCGCPTPDAEDAE